MKRSSTAYIPIALLDILTHESDEEHPIAMPRLISMLEEQGINAVRQTVYRCLDILKDYGYDIVYYNTFKKKGYYLNHIFSSSEVFFLSSMVKENKALSEDDRRQLLVKINSLLPDYHQISLPPKADKSEESLLDKIELILSSTRGRHPLTFNYFDISVHKEKKYRRNGMKYTLIPYALVPYQNKYYCVFYDPSHQDFTNYRLDKMDHIEVDTAKTVEPVPFDLESYMRASFDMYHGNPETVTIRFQKNMSSLLFDQFQMENIIIQKIEEDTFTASLRTAVTPTLTAWLLMYYDRCTVLQPDSLKKRLKSIGLSLIQQYDNKEE